MTTTLVTLMLLLTTGTMVAGQSKDVFIRVKAGDTSILYQQIVFSQALFYEFHECLCGGSDSCTVAYGLQSCPEACQAEHVTGTNIKTQDREFDTYYMCKNDLVQLRLTCQKQVIRDTSQTATYRLLPSACPLTCVGFIWSFSDEYINFNGYQQSVEICGSGCSCPSRSTLTPTQKSTTKPSSSFTSPVDKDDENDNNDVPIGTVVGIVVAVVVIAAIAVVVLVIYMKRRTGRGGSSDNPQHRTTHSGNSPQDNTGLPMANVRPMPYYTNGLHSNVVSTRERTTSNVAHQEITVTPNSTHTPSRNQDNSYQHHSHPGYIAFEDSTSGSHGVMPRGNHDSGLNNGGAEYLEIDDYYMYNK